MSLSMALIVSSSAFAQEGETPTAGDDASAEEAKPELTPAQKQKEATKLFQEGKALSDAKDYGGAIEKFDGAFDYFPDPSLQFVKGEAYQLWGNREVEANNEEGGYNHIRSSVKAYEKFIELSPDPETLEEGSPQKTQMVQARTEAETRIKDLNDSIQKYELAIQRQKDEAAAEAEADRIAKEEADAEIRSRKEGMQWGLDLIVEGGVDARISAAFRSLLGGTVNWGSFGLDAHVGLDGFVRINGDEGTTARSLTLMDLGAKYSLHPRSVGPFLSLGASYGLVTGEPNDVKLKGDNKTCEILNLSASDECSFEIDKTIALRAGLGYGFESSETTTVALRLDAQYWFYSTPVIKELTGSNLPASAIDKPQTVMSLLFGVEFMFWL